MTNKERNAEMDQLRSQLAPLHRDGVIASLRYKHQMSLRRTGEENQELVNELENEMTSLESKIQPLVNRLRAIEIRYRVEVDAVVYEGGQRKIERYIRNVPSSINVDIDTYTALPDLTDSDILDLYKELADTIYIQDFSEFAIVEVKRI